MNRVGRRCYFLVGALLTLLFANAQERLPAGSAAIPGEETSLKKEMMRLVIEDVAKKPFAAITIVEPAPLETEGGLVLLAPYSVREARIPEVKPPRETKLETILRTGTLWQNAGKKSTIRLWTSGDAGIVLSISR